MITGALRFCAPQRAAILPGFLGEVRNAASSVSSSPRPTKKTFSDRKNRQWHVASAVCVERHPVITRDMNEIETKFYNLMQQKIYQNSMKSDFELRAEREKTIEKKQSPVEEKEDGAIQALQTTTEFEDACTEELMAFPLAPRTYDDTDLKSTDRKLDRSLTLLVEQKLGTHKMYLLPQAFVQNEESLRETAERSLKNVCGSTFRAQIYGNAPVGFVKYAYPKKYRTNNVYGCEVFYFLAKFLDGDMPKDVQYQWLDREELAKALSTDTSKAVSKFLLPD